MATNSLKTDAYKVGDSITGRFRAIGRTTNARNGVFVSIFLDKPVDATSFSINTGTAANCYISTGVLFTVPANSSASSQSISNNILIFIVPISDYAASSGLLALCEFDSMTITFS